MFSDESAILHCLTCCSDDTSLSLGNLNGLMKAHCISFFVRVNMLPLTLMLVDLGKIGVAILETIHTDPSNTMLQ